MKAPKAPPPVNPGAAAAAQTGTNLATVAANQITQNSNEITPYGNINYTVAGKETIQNPIYDANGNLVRYDPMEVNRYNRTTTLSEAEQQKLDANNQLELNMLNIGNDQANRIGGILGTPVSFDGLPEVDTQNNAAIDKYSEAIYGRLNPELDRARQARMTELANQGVRPGSEAYREAVALQDRGENDARMQTTLGGYQVADQMFARQNADRQRALTELIQERVQPINEITALTSGSQVNVPTSTPYQGASATPAQIGSYMYASNDQARANAQMKAQQNNAIMSGLFGLGKAGITAGMGGF